MKARSTVSFLMPALIVAAFATTVSAHHSYAEFADAPVLLQGTIVSVEFANPHTIISLRSTDGDVYRLTWNPAFQLANRGVVPGALKTGDALIVSGYPHRDPAVHEISKLREVRRPSDGWTWRPDGSRAGVPAVQQ